MQPEGSSLDANGPGQFIVQAPSMNPMLFSPMELVNVTSLTRSRQALQPLVYSLGVHTSRAPD